MSEEVQDAGIAVPQAMIRGYLLNGSIGLIIVITYLVSDMAEECLLFGLIYELRYVS